MSTYGTILSDVYRRLGLPTTPVSATTTRLAAFLNDTLQEIVSEPGIGAWIDRNEPPFTFASVANQAVYGLNIPRVLSVQDRTNDRTLEMRSREWYDQAEPDPTSNSGTPSVWIPLGFSAVSIQPSNASELFVISSSASDNGTVTAFLEGIRTGGYPRALSVAMNGITAVSFSAAVTDFIQVTKFYVSAAAVGTITLREDSGIGTVLATIPIGQTQTPYRAIALWPTPSAAITYSVDSERDLPDMANANDEPPFPARFHRVITQGILWREYEKTDDDRRKDAKEHYYRGLAQLRFFVSCPPDYLPSRGQMGVSRSRFGAGFPATDY